MKKTVFLAAAALAAAVPAHAVTVVTNTGNSATPSDLSVFEDFEDDVADGSTVFANSVENVALRPVGSTGNFGAVLGGATRTFTFARPTVAFGLLAGSVDSYNRLRLTFADGTFEDYDGSASAGANAYFTFTRGAGDSRIASVTLASDTNSFEFDNVAMGAVPEPTTWAMMILGFGVIGAAIRRRRTTVAALRPA